MDRAAILRESRNVLTRRNVKSVEQRRTLALKVVVSADAVARLMLYTSGVNLATAGTDDEAVGLCAGKSSAHSDELRQAEACKRVYSAVSEWSVK